MHHPDRPGGNPVAFRAMQNAFEYLHSYEKHQYPEEWQYDDEYASRQQSGEQEFPDTPSEGDWHPGPAHDNWTAEDYALYEAVWDCDLARCFELLKAGGRPDGYQNDVWGGTTLMLAAQHGNVKLVRALLGHGASPFAADSDGITASKWATRRKRWDALELIERRMAMLKSSL